VANDGGGTNAKGLKQRGKRKGKMTGSEKGGRKKKVGGWGHQLPTNVCQKRPRSKKISKKREKKKKTPDPEQKGGGEEGAGQL